MRKVALVFVLAVIVPSLVLAWLAVRSLRDQQFVLERQQSMLYQGVTDSLAKEITDYLAGHQREFNAQVENLIAANPRVAAASFHESLQKHWPLAEVGFCVTLSGSFLCPSPMAGPECGVFLVDNAAFLGNRESAEVYGNTSWPVQGLNNNVQVQILPANNDLTNAYNYNLGKAQTRKVTPQKGEMNTAPVAVLNDQTVSRVVPSEAEFRQLVGDAREGMIARFLQNKLKLMYWYRSEKDPGLIFGAQLHLPRLLAGLRDLVHVDPALTEQICLVLLDDNAKPIASSHPQFTADWKRPFVATEIGEALPHWEAAVYPLNPTRLSQSVRTLKLTLGLLIALLVTAIGVGSWLIVTNLNRELTLARQKTDFVSNVSHELKTPLTSIRMFSELLAEGRVGDPAKQRSYLSIITAEAARLTRLINNVLDFSRLERGEKKYNFQECDLVKVIRETAESYRPHLENNGFKLDSTLPQDGLRVRGDCDALAQIIVNLLSNAEKYSNGAKEITVLTAQRDGPLPCAEVRVMDRGPGVPRGSEERIFEKFYRAHDSLSSGIQGSGLGLTLARQIARAHGGDVTYEPRDGGGSVFCLRLPVIQT